MAPRGRGAPSGARRGRAGGPGAARAAGHKLWMCPWPGPRRRGGASIAGARGGGEHGAGTAAVLSAPARSAGSAGPAGCQQRPRQRICFLSASALGLLLFRSCFYTPFGKSHLPVSYLQINIVHVSLFNGKQKFVIVPDVSVHVETIIPASEIIHSLVQKKKVHLDISIFLYGF